ncbi:LysR family transcriptional regulator [Pyxidicoccus xibeiensis]|uniref:LysR family transcriptional regulator n=1 Tax=Pyxidicoccus xibeiensis TaxID=2906759 RepID=UPI0020A7A03A|nr:LysR family transcriptional regulator [Pyxidicoccus xibeiensis]MCP3143838.1 LysR family transcriptional regulator [Pyxidicoccus xibeiensis]
MVLFAAVVREGSFTGAARRFGITKQSVSERIGNLEARLGVRLLERTTRRLRVTGSGASYYERCAEIATQIDEANNEVQRRQSEPVGLLRVSAPVFYGRRYLAPVVLEFLARYPEVRVELVLSNRRADLLFEEGFDVAVHIGRLDDSSLVARKVGEGAVHFVASPAFLSRHGTPTARELGSARCVALSAFETWVVGGVKARIEPVLMVNDFEVACDAAIAGVGIARVPAALCRDAVRDGRLKVLFAQEPPLLLPVYAVYPSRRNVPEKVRRFVDALATLVQPMLPLPPRATGRTRKLQPGARGPRA